MESAASAVAPAAGCSPVVVAQRLNLRQEYSDDRRGDGRSAHAGSRTVEARRSRRPSGPGRRSSVRDRSSNTTPTRSTRPASRPARRRRSDPCRGTSAHARLEVERHPSRRAGSCIGAASAAPRPRHRRRDRGCARARSPITELARRSERGTRSAAPPIVPSTTAALARRHRQREGAASRGSSFRSNCATCSMGRCRHHVQQSMMAARGLRRALLRDWRAWLRAERATAVLRADWWRRAPDVRRPSRSR